MGMSIDVRLKKSVTPKFPDRCVVCGQPGPDASVTVSTHAIGWWTWLLWIHGTRFSINFLACTHCAGSLRRQLWLRWLVTFALIVAAVLLLFPLLSEFRGAARRWLAMGGVIVALSPWFLWQVFFPPPVDLTAYTDEVDYEFRDQDYAEEFAALNGTVTDAASMHEPGE
jgi:hypothetical protein